MKFYIVEHASGEVAGCVMTKREARELCESLGLTSDDARVTALDVPVNAETVRRLIAGEGYAESQTEVKL